MRMRPSRELYLGGAGKGMPCPSPVPALSPRHPTNAPICDLAVDAIVVLGCRVRIDVDGRLTPGALSRRVDAAALAYAGRTRPDAIVVASGGRHWDGLVEADVMARELVRRGVPEGAIVRERCSLSTGDNARLTAKALGRRGLETAAVVTCDWHLPRALVLFGRLGVAVCGVAAREPIAPRLRDRIGRAGRERVLQWVAAPPWRAQGAGRCVR